MDDDPTDVMPILELGEPAGMQEYFDYNRYGSAEFHRQRAIREALNECPHGYSLSEECLNCEMYIQAQIIGR